MMARIVVEAESNMAEFTQPRRRQQRRLSIAEAICESIAHAAEDLHMGAIAVFTETGNTAILISKYRPQAEIFAFCRDAAGMQSPESFVGGAAGTAPAGAHRGRNACTPPSRNWCAVAR